VKERVRKVVPRREKIKSTVQDMGYLSHPKGYQTYSTVLYTLKELHCESLFPESGLSSPAVSALPEDSQLDIL